MAAEEIIDVQLVQNLDLLVSQKKEIKAAAMEIAKAIAAKAQEDAPVDTGAYRDSITVAATPRGARVFATDEKSSWIEFGNNHQAAQFILRNAAESLGLKFRKRR